MTMVEKRLIRETAKRAAEELTSPALAESSKAFAATTGMSVESICKFARIRIVTDPLLRSSAEIYGPSHEPCGGGWCIHIRPLQGVTRRRFVLAHEIGHWYARSRDVKLSREDEEWFCDEFARELLLPRFLLDRWVENVRRKSAGLTLQAVIEGARSAGVSQFVFVRALMHEQRQLEVDQSGIVMVARQAYSWVRRSEPDLRIDAVAPPMGTYIPVNRRLGSVGLTELANSFAEMEQRETRIYNGTISLIFRNLAHRSVSVRCFLQYIKQGREARAQYLLAVGRVLTDTGS